MQCLPRLSPTRRLARGVPRWLYCRQNTNIGVVRSSPATTATIGAGEVGVNPTLSRNCEAVTRIAEPDRLPSPFRRTVERAGKVCVGVRQMPPLTTPSGALALWSGGTFRSPWPSVSRPRVAPSAVPRREERYL
jgi:hypothetical protein